MPIESKSIVKTIHASKSSPNSDDRRPLIIDMRNVLINSLLFSRRCDAMSQNARLQFQTILSKKKATPPRDEYVYYTKGVFFHTWYNLSKCAKTRIRRADIINYCATSFFANTSKKTSQYWISFAPSPYRTVWLLSYAYDLYSLIYAYTRIPIKSSTSSFPFPPIVYTSFVYTYNTNRPERAPSLAVSPSTELIHLSRHVGKLKTPIKTARAPII